MKKEIDCEIINDLLPLLASDALEKEAEEIVKSHLANCEKCLEIYQNMEGNSIENVIIPIKKYRIKKNNDIRNLIIYLCFVLLLILLVLGEIIL